MLVRAMEKLRRAKGRRSIDIQGRHPAIGWILPAKAVGMLMKWILPAKAAGVFPKVNVFRWILPINAIGMLMLVFLRSLAQKYHGEVTVQSLL